MPFNIVRHFSSSSVLKRACLDWNVVSLGIIFLCVVQFPRLPSLAIDTSDVVYCVYSVPCHHHRLFDLPTASKMACRNSLILFLVHHPHIPCSSTPDSLSQWQTLHWWTSSLKQSSLYSLVTVSIACTANDCNTTNSLAVNQQIFKTTWQVFPRHLVISWSPLSNSRRPLYYGNRQLDWHKLWQEHWFQVNEECCHKIKKHDIYDIVWQNWHVHLLVKLVASHMFLVYCNSLTEIHSRFKHYVYLVMHALITVRAENGSSVVWIWQIFLWWRRSLDDNRKRVHDTGVVNMVIPFLQEHQHPELTKVACGFCLNSSVDYGMCREDDGY